MGTTSMAADVGYAIAIAACSPRCGRRRVYHGAGACSVLFPSVQSVRFMDISKYGEIYPEFALTRTAVFSFTEQCRLRSRIDSTAQE